jgi:uncharacterized protein (DUF3084 family)
MMLNYRNNIGDLRLEIEEFRNKLKAQQIVERMTPKEAELQLELMQLMPKYDNLNDVGQCVESILYQNKIQQLKQTLSL